VSPERDVIEERLRKDESQASRLLRVLGIRGHTRKITRKPEEKFEASPD
jgi:hypothetical protein